MKTQEIVQRLWNLCHVLRDDGITYHQYVTELTYLLFLKMAKEQGGKVEAQVPKGYRWDDLTADWREQHPDVEPASELLKRIRIERRKKWEETEFAKLKAKGKVPTDDRWKQKYVEPEPMDDSELPELPEGVLGDGGRAIHKSRGRRPQEARVHFRGNPISDGTKSHRRSGDLI